MHRIGLASITSTKVIHRGPHSTTVDIIQTMRDVLGSPVSARMIFR